MTDDRKIKELEKYVQGPKLTFRLFAGASYIGKIPAVQGAVRGLES